MISKCMVTMEYISKKYIFRADGNSKIGVGHIMRTLTIATALRKQLEADPILFICADEDSAAVVESRGFQSQVLGTAYDHMEDELPIWQQLGIENAVILIDSYYATDDYIIALKQYGRVAILDDLQEHAYPVDVVINYNVFANPDIYAGLYENRDGTSIYLGAEYAPLRGEFTEAKRRQNSPVSAQPTTEDTRVCNILITTGGGDKDNIAGKIYDVLSSYEVESSTNHKTDDNNTIDINDTGTNNACDTSTTTYHIVSGVFNPYFQQLKELEQQRGDLKVHHDVQDMASLISDCDIAITAGGSTIYEICSLGVPLICFSYARNQEQLVEYIGEHVAYSAGAYDKDPAKTLSTISDLINNTYSNSDVLEQISNKEQQLVDGKGADRIGGIIRHIME